MGAWIMAGVTFREGARKKVLWMALLAGAAFLALFATGLHFQIEGLDYRKSNLLIRVEVLRALLMVGLYAVDQMSIVITVLMSVDTLSGEIASGTLHGIATKPVSRRQVLLGKWLGFVGMVTAFVIVMVGGITSVTWMMGRVLPRHLLAGTFLIWLECILLLSLTILFGTTLSTLTSGVVVLGLHGLAFIGGWIEQAGALTHTPSALNVGIAASVIMPSEALWRRAVFEMQSPLIGALNLSPFSNASVPSGAMIVYSVLYLTFVLALALRRFRLRDL